MGLLEQIIQDTQRITSSLSGFGSSITLTAPTNETITLNGLHVKHHLGIDTDGNAVNSKKASVAISERLMNGYPLRNLKGEVNLKNHKVEVADSTGVVCKYIIRQWFPDETIGLIVCILEINV